ncbi:hypothetical protein K0M31_007358, partial [Melipona bicolor]
MENERNPSSRSAWRRVEKFREFVGRSFIICDGTRAGTRVCHSGQSEDILAALRKITPNFCLLLDPYIFSKFTRPFDRMKTVLVVKLKKLAIAVD